MKKIPLALLLAFFSVMQSAVAAVDISVISLSTGRTFDGVLSDTDVNQNHNTISFDLSDDEGNTLSLSLDFDMNEAINSGAQTYRYSEKGLYFDVIESEILYCYSFWYDETSTVPDSVVTISQLESTEEYDDIYNYTEHKFHRFKLEFEINCPSDSQATAYKGTYFYNLQKDGVNELSAPLLKVSHQNPDAGDLQARSGGVVDAFIGGVDAPAGSGVIQYEWKQTSGEEVVIVASNSGDAKFFLPDVLFNEEELLNFELKMSSESGLSETLSLPINVRSKGSKGHYITVKKSNENYTEMSEVTDHHQFFELSTTSVGSSVSYILNTTPYSESFEEGYNSSVSSLGFILRNLATQPSEGDRLQLFELNSTDGYQQESFVNELRVVSTYYSDNVDRGSTLQWIVDCVPISPGEVVLMDLPEAGAVEVGYSAAFKLYCTERFNNTYYTLEGQVGYNVAHFSKPVAVAGADISAAISQTVTLDASESTDKQGQALRYVWSIDGDRLTEEGAVVSYQVPNDAAGKNLVATVSVVDSEGYLSQDQTVIKVGGTPSSDQGGSGGGVFLALLPLLGLRRR